MRKAGALVALLVVLAAASAFARSAPAAPAAKTTVVTVSMFEMGFKLSKKVVPRGTVIFKVTNDGKLEHDFSFGGARKSPLLQPGDSASFTAKFLKPGKFTYICTVEGHASAGMLGVFTVK